MVINKSKRITAPEPDAVAWNKLYGGLSAETQHTIDAETEAIREDLVHGSKLRTAQRFARVRKALVPDHDANAAEKKDWSLYLRVHKFPGISRATGFRVMDSWDAAEGMFHPVFLDAFAASEYAVGINPSKLFPLGKYTDIAKGFDEAKPSADLGTDAALELVKRVVIESTKLPKPPKKGRAEREVAFCTAALKKVKCLAKFAVGGDEPTTEDVLEELELLVAHIYHAAGQLEEFTIEPKRINVHTEMITPDAAAPSSSNGKRGHAAATEAQTKQGAAPSRIPATAKKAAPVDDSPSAGDSHDEGVPRKPAMSVKVSDVSPHTDTAAPIAMAHAATMADAMVDAALLKHGWLQDNGD